MKARIPFDVFWGVVNPFLGGWSKSIILASGRILVWSSEAMLRLAQNFYDGPPVVLDMTRFVDFCELFGSSTEMVINESQVLIQGPKGRFTVGTLEFTSSLQERSRFECECEHQIPCSVLDAIEFVSAFVAPSTVSKELSYVKVGDKKVFGTDNMVIALQEEVKGVTGDVWFVPGGCMDVVGVFRETMPSVSVGLRDRVLCLLSDDGSELYILLGEPVQYPSDEDVSEILSQPVEQKLLLEDRGVGELEAVGRALDAVFPKGVQEVQVECQQNGVVVTAVGASQEFRYEVENASVEGGEVVFGTSFALLLKALRAVDTKEIQIRSGSLAVVDRERQVIFPKWSV